MRVHWLQHAEFEGLGNIRRWVDNHDHVLTCTRLYKNEKLPPTNRCDMLIVMGGPMGIHDEEAYRWLVEEKQFIREFIATGRPVFGICLGAQLIADVLGAEVGPNKAKEIGWFNIKKKESIEGNLQSLLPNEQIVLHWHGDTFTVPDGAVLLCSSSACENQGFVYRDQVLALQYHLEIGAAELGPLLENCRHEIVDGPWIQTEEEILRNSKNDHGCNAVLWRLLDYLVHRSGKNPMISKNIC